MKYRAITLTQILENTSKIFRHRMLDGCHDFTPTSPQTLNAIQLLKDKRLAVKQKTLDRMAPGLAQVKIDFFLTVPTYT